MTCTCATEPEPATAARPVSRKRIHRDFLRWNAAQPHPMPICCACDMAYRADEGDWLFKGRCTSCGIAQREAIILRIVKRKGHRKAIRALCKLSR